MATNIIVHITICSILVLTAGIFQAISLYKKTKVDKSWKNADKDDVPDIMNIYNQSRFYSTWAKILLIFCFGYITGSIIITICL